MADFDKNDPPIKELLRAAFMKSPSLEPVAGIEVKIVRTMTAPPGSTMRDGGLVDW
jgi:hypothetical protein